MNDDTTSASSVRTGHWVDYAGRTPQSCGRTIATAAILLIRIFFQRFDTASLPLGAQPKPAPLETPDSLKENPDIDLSPGEPELWYGPTIEIAIGISMARSFHLPARWWAAISQSTTMSASAQQHAPRDLHLIGGLVRGDLVRQPIWQ